MRFDKIIPLSNINDINKVQQYFKQRKSNIS